MTFESDLPLSRDLTADQRLCLRYIDGTIPPLPKSEISVAVQPGMRRTCSFVVDKAGLILGWSDPGEEFSLDEAQLLWV